MKQVKNDLDSEDVVKEHLPISQLAVKILRKSIIEGKLPPGARVSVRELAKKWGISRTPIREAVRELQSEGLVVLVPRKGVFVRKFTPQEIENIYAVRMVLEPFAVGLAVPNLDRKRIEKIEKLHLEIKEALKDSNVDILKIAYLNEDFHFSIYECSNNQILCDTIRGLWHKIFSVILMIIAYPDRGKDMIHEHEAVVEGVVKRDKEKAVEALREHMRITKDILLRRYGDGSVKLP